jgi:predicted alpha/beta-fold hydrolase
MYSLVSRKELIIFISKILLIRNKQRLCNILNFFVSKSKSKKKDKMKSLFTLATIILTAFAVNAQSLYIKTFGNPKDKPLLFLHGGPGYNSVNFEQTTADRLSKSGFYVIVYDRRGEGRSLDNNAKFTFEQTFDDINTILAEKKIEKVSLLGHSFGGCDCYIVCRKIS